MKANKHSIQHRIVLRADVTAVSPMRIGNGKGDASDLILLRNKDGHPYIPASSIAGVLKAKWDKAQFDAPVSNKTETFFWGSDVNEEDKNKASQSHFKVSNMDILDPKRAATVVRDGVSIHKDNGTVDGRKKYDYEILEPGSQFEFRAEIVVRAGIDATEVLGMVHWIKDMFYGDLQVGGNTSKGFGRLECASFAAYHFDFSAVSSRKAQATAWLQYCTNGDLTAATAVEFGDGPSPLQAQAPNDLVVEVSFALTHGLIIGGPTHKNTKAQKGHLYSNGVPVISGTSLMGSLRHRAGRILGIAQVNDPEKQLNRMFGYSGEEKQNIQRSRIDTREAVVNKVLSSPQTRIRTDRFTHAPVEGGLFDSEPIWNVEIDPNTEQVKLWWRISDYQAGEAALLLHLVRDLWTEDLALGGEKNIGRGRLRGQCAEISGLGFKATINRTAQGISIDDQQDVLKRFDRPLAALFHPQTQQHEPIN